MHKQPYMLDGDPADLLTFANGWNVAYLALACGHYECCRWRNKDEQSVIAGALGAVRKDDIQPGPAHCDADEFVNFLDETRKLPSDRCEHEWKHQYSVFSGDMHVCTKCNEVRQDA